MHAGASFLPSRTVQTLQHKNHDSLPCINVGSEKEELLTSTVTNLQRTHPRLEASGFGVVH